MRFRNRAAKEAMASNSLAVEVQAMERAGVRLGLWLAIIGCAIILVIAASAPKSMWPLLAFAVVFWAVICLHGEHAVATSSANYRKVASGLRGETFVCNLLAGVDNRFVVRNGVLLPNPRSRTGHTEADFVLIGRKALYLVETKNNSGQIEATEKDREWKITLETSEGGRDHTTMRNPVRQVKVQAKVLRERLAEKGLNPIIQPTVGFSSPAASITEREKLSVPVFTYPMDDLVERIRAYEKKLEGRPDLDVEQVNATLDELHADALRVAKPIRK